MSISLFTSTVRRPPPQSLDAKLNSHSKLHEVLALIQAVKAGADAADAVYACDASTEVSVRLGNLEDVSRSEGEEIGLRVFEARRLLAARLPLARRGEDRGTREKLYPAAVFIGRAWIVVVLPVHDSGMFRFSLPGGQNCASARIGKHNCSKKVKKCF